MIKLIDKIDCTGCGACVNTCPIKCISMQRDEEGFAYPVIDLTHCRGCGACQRACGRIGSVQFNKRQSTVMAAFARDNGIRRSSSSGGIFSLLAECVINEGGAVNGVMFDSEMKLRHLLVDSKNNICKIRGSKYVQSDVGNIYADIKGMLDTGRTILFTSTPCQVAGLKGYLGKEYDNLVTCDFVCHGVPSPGYFERYISHKMKIANRTDVVDFQFRDLDGWGWEPAMIFGTGEKIVFETYLDEFMLPFLAGLNYRESCYNCKFARPERCSDITIGDFWSIKKYVLRMKPFRHGTSIVMVNSEKGQRLFSRVEARCIQRKFPINTIKDNEQLWHPSRRPKSRDEFYIDSNRLGSVAFVRKYGMVKRKRHPLHHLADAYRYIKRKVNAIVFAFADTLGVDAI